jgi:hypothetical protein
MPPTQDTDGVQLVAFAMPAKAKHMAANIIPILRAFFIPAPHVQLSPGLPKILKDILIIRIDYSIPRM